MLTFIIFIICVLVAIAILAWKLMEAHERIFRIEMEKIDLEAESDQMYKIIEDLRASIQRLNRLNENNWRRTSAPALIDTTRIKSLHLRPMTLDAAQWAEHPTIRTQVL